MPVVEVEVRIYTLRGLRVMLSTDLAALYGVPTKVLLQTVRRNMERFPRDFAFQLSGDEFANLRSQTVTSKRGGSRYAPFASKKKRIGFIQDH